MIHRLLLMLLCTMTVACSTVAQPPTLSKELIAYISRPDQKAELRRMFLTQWESTFGSCEDIYFGRIGIAPVHAVEFGAAGDVQRGSWKIVSDLTGCNETHTLTVFYVANEGELHRLSLLPGGSIADPLLQQDAIGYANMAMGLIRPKECAKTKVMDTKFLSFGATNDQAIPGRQKRTWYEEWTLNACGVVGLVNLTFRPDAHGTAISTKMAELQ